MTRIKSLGIPESGYQHRTHRSKKNRRQLDPQITLKIITKKSEQREQREELSEVPKIPTRSKVLNQE